MHSPLRCGNTSISPQSKKLSVYKKAKYNNAGTKKSNQDIHPSRQLFTVRCFCAALTRGRRLGRNGGIRSLLKSISAIRAAGDKAPFISDKAANRTADIDKKTTAIRTYFGTALYFVSAMFTKKFRRLCIHQLLQPLHPLHDFPEQPLVPVLLAVVPFAFWLSLI